MSKITLNASASIDLTVNSKIGESTAEILNKLQTGEYCLSLFSDEIHKTETLGSDNPEVVATIRDRNIEYSDYSFEEAFPFFFLI